MATRSVLMVEGTDDEYVVKHICGQHRLGEIEKIHAYGGKDKLLEGIGVRLKESDIGVLGIMLDADLDLRACWQSVSGRLAQGGYEHLPANPDPNGTIIPRPEGSLLPKVGIWIMPDNSIPGILEDFLQFLVPPGDQLLPLAEAAIDRIPSPRLFAAPKVPKAILHTWLAWQADPGRPFGQAITARFLDSSLPAATTFANWLQRTFFLYPDVVSDN